MFFSVNVEQDTREDAVAALDALRAELEAKGVWYGQRSEIWESYMCWALEPVYEDVSHRILPY